MGRRISILMRATIPLVVSGFLGAGFVSCGGNDPDDPGVTYPLRIAIYGIDQQDGVFDAAPAEDGTSRIWMSYSQVSLPQTGFRWVSTRAAYSDDHGLTWADSGAINSAAVPAAKPNGETRDLVWEHEVSRLVYDPSDTGPNKWKILWFRYLSARDFVNNNWITVPLFQYGWIELKTAFSPDGSWSADRKLFAGSLYAVDQPYNDSVSPASPAPIRLDTLDSGLSSCLAFTEPGILAASDRLYISLKCATGGAGKIVLLQCAHDFSSCTYKGTLIDDSEASYYGDYDGFSGTELVQSGGQTYLIATPTKIEGYRGCLVFTIENLTTTPSLKRSDGIHADLKLTVSGSAGSFNGACGYSAGSTGSGIIYGEYFPGQTPEFRLFGGGQNL